MVCRTVCRIDIQATTKMPANMRKKKHNKVKEQEWEVNNSNKRRKGAVTGGREGLAGG